MIIDIHTHLDDVVGGSKVLVGQKRKEYQRWIANLSMMRDYLNGLAKLNQEIADDGKVFACALSIEPNSDFEKLLEYQSQEPRILPFISPDFTLSDYDMIERVERFARHSYGMKIHPIIQGYRVNDRRVLEAVKGYSRFNKPVILHTGQADYGNYFEPCPYDKTLSDIESTIELVEAFPDVTFILGHAGMFEHVEWAKRLSQYPNVYIDSSFKYANELQLLKDYYGTDRILFGSDFPFHEPSDIDDVKETFTEEEQVRVFSGNARKILKL